MSLGFATFLRVLMFSIINLIPSLYWAQAAQQEQLSSHSIVSLAKYMFSEGARLAISHLVWQIPAPQYGIGKTFPRHLIRES